MVGKFSNETRLDALEDEMAKLRAQMRTEYKPPAARGVECPPIQLQYVLIPVFSLLTGYSEKAVRQKILNGVWIQGRHYRKAPDGRILMDLASFAAWVRGEG